MKALQILALVAFFCLVMPGKAAAEPDQSMFQYMSKSVPVAPTVRVVNPPRRLPTGGVNAYYTNASGPVQVYYPPGTVYSDNSAYPGYTTYPAGTVLVPVLPVRTVAPYYNGNTAVLSQNFYQQLVGLWSARHADGGQVTMNISINGYTVETDSRLANRTYSVVYSNMSGFQTTAPQQYSWQGPDTFVTTTASGERLVFQRN